MYWHLVYIVVTKEAIIIMARVIVHMKGERFIKNTKNGKMWIVRPLRKEEGKKLGGAEGWGGTLPQTKERRFWPGAMREIRRFQKSINLLILKLPF